MIGKVIGIGIGLRAKEALALGGARSHIAGKGPRKVNTATGLRGLAPRTDVPGFPLTAGRTLYSELIDTTLHTTLLYRHMCTSREEFSKASSFSFSSQQKARNPTPLPYRFLSFLAACLPM